MENYQDILLQHLREQIALEEHLCKVIQDHVSLVDGVEFADAKHLLESANKTLEHHFIALNQLLDNHEHGGVGYQSTNGAHVNSSATEATRIRISQILRDVYSALNQITISNTLLHTIALALNSQQVADIALKHLENLTPIVVKLGQLVPAVAARELRIVCPTTYEQAAVAALSNTRSAWRKASLSSRYQ